MPTVHEHFTVLVFFYCLKTGVVYSFAVCKQAFPTQNLFNSLLPPPFPSYFATLGGGGKTVLKQVSCSNAYFIIISSRGGLVVEQWSNNRLHSAMVGSNLHQVWCINRSVEETLCHNSNCRMPGLRVYNTHLDVS